MSVRRSMLGLVSVAILTVAACSSAGVDGSPSVEPLKSPPPITDMDPAQLLFVSPGGDDGNPGTESAPLATIVRAAELVKPGMMVVVEDGTYEGSITTSFSGTEDARIVFVARTKWGANIVGDGSDRFDGPAWQNYGDYVDITGFDISGDGVDGLLSGGSFVRIADNRVHEFSEGNCITTANSRYDLTDIDVIGNVTFGCGDKELDHGIYVSHTRGVVTNNMSYGNAGFGIHCWHNCNELVISNNLVFDNPEGGIVIGQGDSPNYGDVSADGFVVSNNIAVDNGRDGIRESGATGSDNLFVNNLLWDNGTEKISLKTGSETGTINSDPAFVDFRPDGSGDYRLQSSSPAVDAGVSAGAPAVAFDGTPRPQARGIDIGIYER